MSTTFGDLVPLWGLMPFVIILGSMIITGVLFLVLVLLSKTSAILSPEALAEILFAMGSILLGVMLVLTIMRVSGCGRVSPYEAFTVQENPSESLNALEAEVCKQLREVFVFKQSDLGKAAIDNPLLLADAIYGMVQAAVGPITECTAPLPLPSSDISIPPLTPTGIPVSDEMFLTHNEQIADRLDRAYRTLKFVVEPQAAATFATTDTCSTKTNENEAFDDLTPSAATTLINQLTECVSLAASIRSRYLDPIARKQADLRAGRLSDCDRQKGAGAGMGGGS